MIAIPNISKPQNCAECPISALSEFRGFVCKLNRNNDKSNCPLIEIVTCGECKKHSKNSCPMTFTYAVITDDNDYCVYAERRADVSESDMR